MFDGYCIVVVIVGLAITIVNTDYSLALPYIQQGYSKKGRYPGLTFYIVYLKSLEREREREIERECLPYKIYFNLWLYVNQKMKTKKIKCVRDTYNLYPYILIHGIPFSP